MNKGTALTLGFGVILVGALLLTSGVRNHSLSEVLQGETAAAANNSAGAAPETSNSEGSTMAGAALHSASQPAAPGKGGTKGNQSTFARWFSSYTGLNLGVVEKWLLAEQPPGSPSKPGSNNWLNIQYTDSGPNSEYYRIARLNPQAAAKASAEWAAKNQPSIIKSAGSSPHAQEQAIINSGWASSHYGGSL